MKPDTSSPWKWIPSLYFAEGIPYVIAATGFATIFYKNMGLSNTEIALFTSWLYLPWVVKPFWSPFVDLFKTKRWWVLTMESLIGVLLATTAFCIPTTYFLQSTLALLWLIAFSSATHDIAADGFYMLALNEHLQSWFVGIRSTFYRLALIVGQGLLVIAAGYLEHRLGNVPLAWSCCFAGIGLCFLLIALLHLWVLPKVETANQTAHTESLNEQIKHILRDFGNTFAEFFRKDGIGWALLFILLYRLGEAMLVKISSPFLLDPRDMGGLGISTQQVGWLYGTLGTISLTVGGILGGMSAAKYGLKRCMLPMMLLMNLPNGVYVYFAWAQPADLYLIATGICLEQFGYGFGFTAFMLYLIYLSRGPLQTSHYAFCTGFMALGMMLPGMVAGAIQESIGYPLFFLLICILTVPGMLIGCLLPIDKHFGIKHRP